MRQTKGFRHSDLTSQRDYVDQGNLAALALVGPDFARSGMHDAAAFTVANTIFSAGFHLLGRR